MQILVLRHSSLVSDLSPGSLVVSLVRDHVTEATSTAAVLMEL